VHVLELGQRERLADRVEVDRLAARHAARAAGDARRAAIIFSWSAGRRRAVLGEELEGEALQRVAREERRGLVELHVAGGLAAAQDVVVHAGQVVVDERVRMDHLDRGRGDCAAARRRLDELAAAKTSIARTRLPPPSVE
jgi:hypothetical protein